MGQPWYTAGAQKNDLALANLTRGFVAQADLQPILLGAICRDKIVARACVQIIIPVFTVFMFCGK